MMKLKERGLMSKDIRAGSLMISKLFWARISEVHL